MYTNTIHLTYLWCRLDELLTTEILEAHSLTPWWEDLKVDQGRELPSTKPATWKHMETWRTGNRGHAKGTSTAKESDEVVSILSFCPQRPPYIHAPLRLPVSYVLQVIMTNICHYWCIKRQILKLIYNIPSFNIFFCISLVCRPNFYFYTFSNT